MNKKSIKELISRRKFSILTIIILLVIIGGLFLEKQSYKYTLFYQYQAIPDIELTNTLTTTPEGFVGEVRGFVKFYDTTNQPRDLRQYYILKPLNKFSGDSQQYFSLEEIMKMRYLSPRSLGFSELVEVNETNNATTLEDEFGNQFFIDKTTKKVSMKDVTGDSTILITSDFEYGDFMKEWLLE